MIPSFRKARSPSARTALPCCAALVAGLLLVAPPLRAAEPSQSAALHIDIPVALTQAQVVFNMDHPAFEGDNPTGLNFMRVVQEDFAQAGTKASMVAIFHGEIGYMLLDDARYNAVRHSTRGNPYKTMILALQEKGVRFEACGQTARNNGWVNTDFLPGVKVVTSANLRILQLVQQGYVQIQP